MSNPTYRIFIVDDHPAIREMLAMYIAFETGMEVCGQAASGNEALEKLAEADCDLVLVDVAMPGMNGIELVRQLRARRPDIRCLMVSGHAEQLYVKASMEAGARGYVMKGDPDAILLAIRQVVDGGVYLSQHVREEKPD